MGKLVLKVAVGMVAVWSPEWDGQRWRLLGFVLLSASLPKEGTGTLQSEHP